MPSEAQKPDPWAAERVALVTGATSGYGAALVRRIVAGGGRVVATGRRSDRLAALRAELGAESVLTLEHDVRDRAATLSLMDNLPPTFAEIDVLVNNAGLALGLGKVPDASLDDWETMIETNILGLVRVTHAVLPKMVALGRGHIVNLSSVAANYPYPGGNVYGATKAFVRQFSLNLRADLLGTPIRVTSIEPGMSETEFALVRNKGDAGIAAATYAGLTPLSADDVAGTIELALRMPAHVNVNSLEVMPVAQAFAMFATHRQT